MPLPPTPEKSGGKPRPGGNDDLIPLVIASHPGSMSSLNYNRMKELDPQKRTYYALEHKFRKFKARAREICDAEGGGKALDFGKASVEKAGAKSPHNQHEDLIPLLIASIPGRLTLNFNRMKELDPHGRTASSLEHKFRKYKAAAKEILDPDGGKATEENGSSSVKTTPTPTPTKKRKTKGEGVKGESDNGEMTPTKKRRVVKRDQKNGDATAAVKKEGNLVDEADRMNDESAKKKKAGAKASDEESEEDAKLDPAVVAKKRKPASAAKKPRPRKKGLAIILKKEPTIPSESDSEDGDEEEIGDSSVKATTTAQPTKKPLKKGLARTVVRKKEAISSSLSEITTEESEEKEEGEEPSSTKAKESARKNGKRKAAVVVDAGAAAADGDNKTDGAANNKKSSNGNEQGEVGGAIAEVDEGVEEETSGVPSKESAIRLLFE